MCGVHMCDDSPRARSPEPGPDHPSLGAAEVEARGRDVVEGTVTSLCPCTHRHVGDPRGRAGRCQAELGRHPPGTRTRPLLPLGAGSPAGPAWGAPCGSGCVGSLSCTPTRWTLPEQRPHVGYDMPGLYFSVYSPVRRGDSRPCASCGDGVRGSGN